MDRLGPQGRAMREHMRTTTTTTMSSVAVHPVQVLVDQLRTGALPTDQLLLGIAHTLPTVRHPGNLELVLHAVVGCLRLYESLDAAAQLVDALHFAVTKKVRVSEPLLLLADFYSVAGTVLAGYRYNWRVVPVLAGFVLASPTRDEWATPEERPGFAYFDHLVLSTFADSLHLDNATPAVISSTFVLCTAAVFLSLAPQQAARLPHGPLLAACVLYVYVDALQGGRAVGTAASTLQQLPAIRHLSRVLAVMEYCFEHALDAGVVEYAAAVLATTADTIAHSCLHTVPPAAWPLLKVLVFSYVVALSGLCSRALKLSGQELPLLTVPFVSTLRSLFSLHFVLEEIGTGGFAAYNFVHLTALDGLIQVDAEAAVQLATRLHHAVGPSPVLYVRPSSAVTASQALFVLGLCEHLVRADNPVCARFCHTTAVPLCLEIVARAQEASSRSVVELAHLAVLAHLATNGPTDVVVLSQVLPYLLQVLRQFPAVLSPAQLTTAVETLAGVLLPHAGSDYGQLLLRLVLERAEHEPSGVPAAERAVLNIVVEPADEAPLPLVPEIEPPTTTKTVLLTALVHALPNAPVGQLAEWWDRVVAASRECSEQERRQVVAAMWKTIGSELDMQRADVLIQWWYRQGRL